jgi:hypothetical protein
LPPSVPEVPHRRQRRRALREGDFSRIVGPRAGGDRDRHRCCVRSIVCRVGRGEGHAQQVRTKRQHRPHGGAKPGTDGEIPLLLGLDMADCSELPVCPRQKVSGRWRDKGFRGCEDAEGGGMGWWTDSKTICKRTTLQHKAPARQNCLPCRCSLFLWSSQPAQVRTGSHLLVEIAA